ncbi:probable inactive peptidyl-prolyl cis-trans isomerase-like 6 [Metopolophium dirhodum]|uniref:probable inactive peptidyl-prolyl cis-trans isomerase-like 6 n=1 Tax=Metopolophium dirhodum TaxID=44670 RepID=UPI00298F5B12|nr:probable inactive peptidyl-prolyl cis-trans isomerase-like 6 [Metopolophium dirhodum]
MLTKMNIKVVGCLLSTSFQTTKYLLFNLVKHRHDLVNKYTIRGLMDIEWTRCLWKINQILGGAKRQDTEAIFINETYIGTYAEFQNYLSVKYNITMSLWSVNCKQLASIDIQDYYNNKSTFVRMVFEVNNWEIGHVIFVLFDKLVPKTCKYFKQLCINKTEGYLNSFIHRIDINNGFIQAGRILNKMAYLKKENFSVSHDRRGVLSLASRRTYFNGPEFIISFRPNPWMNDKYVAFGHAVEGEKTLKIIEKLSNARVISDRQIRITSCDVLPNCTRSVKTKLDTFLYTIIDKIIHKAMYTYAYGKPKPLHLPITTDLEYVKSIIQTLTNKVMSKIEDSASPQETKSLIVVDYSKRSKLRLGSMTIPSAPSSCKDETKRKYSLIKLKPYSAGFNETASRILGTEKISTIKSKRASACSATSIGKNTKYGVNLSADHKDYWKYKKIYDGIAD